MSLDGAMIQTIEAVIGADGNVRLLGEVKIVSPRRALVTILEEPAAVPGEARVGERESERGCISPASDNSGLR